MTMAKRDAIYAGEQYAPNDYPHHRDGTFILKNCDICRRTIAVNNWPDGKSRTPIFEKFVVCVDCDPRAIGDRYRKTGYQIMFPGRLRVIRMAQVTRALARMGCLRPIGGTEEELNDPKPCKCAGCASVKLMTPILADQ